MQYCKDASCDRVLDKGYAHGLCNMHYQRYIRRNRDKIKTIFRHGMSTRPEYRIWSGIKGRCLNPKDPAYARYGGRNITICAEWANNFEVFFSDMGERPTPEHSIDRINNNAGYSPANCRWASPSTQLYNRGMMKSNTSGVKGVHLHKGKWVARIGYNGTHRYLGVYRNKEDAILARKKAELERT